MLNFKYFHLKDVQKLLLLLLKQDQYFKKDSQNWLESALKEKIKEFL